MDVKKVEIFSEATNYGIVRLPERKFPGVVVQGDSLSIMLSLIDSIKERVAESSDDELVGCVEELRESISSYIIHYEQVLKSHGMQLPYVK